MYSKLDSGQPIPFSSSAGLKKKQTKGLVIPPKRMNSMTGMNQPYMNADSQTFYPMGYQQQNIQNSYNDNYNNNPYQNQYQADSPTKTGIPLNIKCNYIIIINWTKLIRYPRKST